MRSSMKDNDAKVVRAKARRLLTVLNKIKTQS